jgi:hypothetical protein
MLLLLGLTLGTVASIGRVGRWEAPRLRLLESVLVAGSWPMTAICCGSEGRVGGTDRREL